LDYFVGAAQDNCLSRALPLLDVARNFHCERSLGCILFCEIELQWPKLAVALQVALEVLKQNDFLFNGCRVVKEVVILYILGRLVSAAVLDALNVAEVEKVRSQCYNLSAIVVKHAVCAVRQLVAEAIFRAKINEFANEIGAGL
jgi:hypothetical protein